MTDVENIEIFTATGALRNDFQEAEIASLSPQRQTTFFALVEAANVEKDAESELAAAKEAQAKAVADHAAVQAEHLRRNPPTSFLDALKAVQNRPTE